MSPRRRTTSSVNLARFADLSRQSVEASTRVGAGDLHCVIEEGPALLRLGPEGLGGEVERSGRDRRGDEGKGNEDHRPCLRAFAAGGGAAWVSRPVTPPPSVTSLPSDRATNPRDR